MGKQRFRKGMSGVLATLMLLQAMPMGASAWSIRDWFGSRDEEEETAQVEVLESREAQEIQLQNGTAVIPSDATESEVKDILFEALVVNPDDDVAPQSLDWEYFGTSQSDPWGYEEQSKWVDIFEGGTWSDKWLLITYEYTVSPLQNADNGPYQVRIKDSGDDEGVTLTKQSKYNSEIKLNDSCTVALPYNEDTSVDYNALREDIWDEVVADTTPDLDWNSAGVSIEYRYNGEDFGNLEGDDGSILGLGSYDPISSGPQVIRISWDGNDRYYDCEETVAVNFTDRTAGTIVLKEDQEVALPYISADEVNYEALKEAIFETVVESITPSNLTAGDVTIEYYAENYLGSEDISGGSHEWAPLEGGTIKNALGISLTYPAISASETPQQIRISWDGNGSYSGFQEETTVTIAERADVIWEYNDNVTVGLVCNEDLSIDYEAMEQAIYEAVVTDNDKGLVFGDVTIEYDASLTGRGNYKTLDNTDWDGFKKFGAGTWKIRFSWDGTQNYQAGSFEVTVTVEDLPAVNWTFNETATVNLVCNEDQSINYEAMEQAIYEAVVTGNDKNLGVGDVTIEYNASRAGDTVPVYEPLDYSATDLGALKKFGAGTWTIRFSWNGTQAYQAGSFTATVTVNDREQIQFTLNEGPYEVGMKFTDDQGYDYAATAQAIYNAVVASNSLDIPYDQMTVEYNTDPTGTFDLFKPLNETDATGLVKFGTGEWEIRISWPGNQQYRGNSVTVNVTTTDNRLESSVALKSGVSFTYNMDPSVMKQAIFDSVIDWENSTLPNKDTLSLDNFTIEYYGTAVLFDGGIDSGIQNWVPVEGKSYDLGGVNLGAYPQLGAGENQQIRVSFNGNADYRPSDSTEGAVTVNKATVKVSVHSDNIYADEALPEGFITTDPADDFDQYVIYAGITSNVTTALYLDLPDRYDNNGVIELLDPIVEGIWGKSFTQMLNDGVTVGELRELLGTEELLKLLDTLNIDTGTFGQILEAVNKMPGILDSVRISFGAPNRAGLYTVAVVTDNQNYETGFGMGFLLVKMRLSGVHLTWNQELGSKISAADAKNFDFGATLSYNGNTTISQESVSYLYSGFTSKWRVYSSTTTPPTEPGRYVMTVVTLGGNYQAAPITRSFQITK